MVNVRGIASLLLVLLLVVSTVAVIYSSHKARQLFSAWQFEQRQALALDEEWGRLLIEHSFWASHDRVRRTAEERMAMRPPLAQDLQLVAEPVALGRQVK